MLEIFAVVLLALLVRDAIKPIARWALSEGLHRLEQRNWKRSVFDKKQTLVSWQWLLRAQRGLRLERR